MHAPRAFAATAFVATALLAPAFGATPGESKLERAEVREAIPREPSIGKMNRDVALAHLRRLGYSPSDKLDLKDRTWEMVDAKTGHRVRIDAVTGKVDDIKP